MTNYLTFSSAEQFSISTTNGKVWDGTLYYSTDTNNWNEWDGAEISSAEYSGEQSVHMRGIENTCITRNTNTLSTWIIDGTDVYCSGNIETLLDYNEVSHGRHPIMGDYCFWRMFYGCESLVTPPDLCAETLSKACYRDMFSKCINLVKPPILRASVLSESCCLYMFDGCSSLMSAPKLLASVAIDGCYYGMFRDCVSLSSIPELLAVSLPEECYSRMFEGCTSIKVSDTKTDEYTIPYRVPAYGNGVLDYRIFNPLNATFADTGGTFTGTPEINKTYYLHNSNSVIPASIPVPTFAADPTSMILGWLMGKRVASTREEPPTYLTFSSTEPFTISTANSAKNWDGELYYSTDTKNWNEWDGKEISSAECFGKNNICMRGVGNNRITSNNKSAGWVLTGDAIECDGNIENLINFETVKNDGQLSCIQSYAFYGMFKNCTNLVSAPKLPTTKLKWSCYEEMFSGCTNLTIPPELPATQLDDKCYYRMFSGCENLRMAPVLSATRLSISCYCLMFENCTSLEIPPELPALYIDRGCYYGMFSGCTSLLAAPALPSSEVSIGSYAYMFLNCTSLVSVPELSAKSLMQNCYLGMFSGCVSLKLSETQSDEYLTPYRIPATDNGTAATDALTDIFSNTGGTFEGTPEINKTYYLHTSNSIV